MQKQPPEVFYKKDALSNFAIFTGKHLKACNFIKKRLQHKRFPVNIAKNYFEEHLRRAASAYVFNKNKRCLCGSKTLHKIDLKDWWIGQVCLSKLVGVMAHISLLREATTFIFKDPTGWLFPKWINKWIWIIDTSIKVIQSQKSYSLKSFLWWNWFWQSARSKALH